VPSVDESLFRREAGRLVAALTRVFGVHNLALAEDVAQDALCRALEVWKFGGLPENPSAWLMATARNRALDVLRRERTARTFAPELGHLLESEWTLAPALQEALGDDAIRDDELRMMFSCCHPRLAQEAQVALILNILCGFGVGEIAGAFLCSVAAVEKRISRGKRILARSKTLFDFAVAGESSLAGRLAAVERALYLLFNEGYHGGGESAVRVALCDEAMRLAALLREHGPSATPASHALGALMSLHASRLPARLDEAGDLIALGHQDRTRWDGRLIAEGRRLLDLSATGPQLTEYHVEAAIAAVHADARTVRDTRWAEIVSLYDTLLAIRPSPVVALHRALAVAELEGPARGLDAVRAIHDNERLSAYPFYFAALGELELRCADRVAATAHFTAALALARNDVERRFIAGRIEACGAVQRAAVEDARTRWNATHGDVERHDPCEWDVNDQGRADSSTSGGKPPA
jgi:RNA polymerase sigma-70 factor (ECF subfamily)